MHAETTGTLYASPVFNLGYAYPREYEKTFQGYVKWVGGNHIKSSSLNVVYGLCITLIKHKARCKELYIAFLPSVLQLLVAANVPGSPILATLMMEAIRPSETWVLTRAIRCDIPEDVILHSHRYENLKSYMGKIF
jgi:hypothetical protein